MNQLVRFVVCGGASVTVRDSCYSEQREEPVGLQEQLDAVEEVADRGHRGQGSREAPVVVLSSVEEGDQREVGHSCQEERQEERQTCQSVDEGFVQFKLWEGGVCVHV